MDLGVFFDKIPDDEHGRSFSDVTGVLLECVSQNGNLLSRYRVEHGRDHLPRESLLLKVVHLNNLAPVIRTGLQSVGFAQVDEIQNIFLEARSSESHRGLQKALSDAGVHANRPANFGHVGTRNLAQGRNGVDRRHALRQKGVGDQFGQLGRPQVGGQDIVARNPVGVYADHGFDGLESLGGLWSTDQDTIGIVQIRHRGTLGQKFGVAQDLEGDVGFFLVGGQDAVDGLGRADGHGRFFDNNLGRRRDSGNVAGTQFAVFDVGGRTGSDSLGFCGRVDRDENDIGFGDFLVQIRRKKQVSSPGFLHALDKTRFVNRQCVGLPGIDLFLRNISHDNANLWAHLGNDSHGRATDVSGSHAKNFKVPFVTHCT
mmetsp:Transcript_7920/g.17017  ORF Transcript_7920/g.17017 Transcript_7920/m.17017 type:complete len:371 (+) Transcript_7920:434-1546(+)